MRMDRTSCAAPGPVGSDISQLRSLPARAPARGVLKLSSDQSGAMSPLPRSETATATCTEGFGQKAPSRQTPAVTPG